MTVGFFLGEEGEFFMKIIIMLYLQWGHYTLPLAEKGKVILHTLSLPLSLGPQMQKDLREKPHN